MHVVIRHYKGSTKLIDELVDRRKDVEELIRGVDGFVAYYLVKTADGGASVSVFQTEENLGGVAAGPPEIIEGQTVIDFT